MPRWRRAAATAACSRPSSPAGPARAARVVATGPARSPSSRSRSARRVNIEDMALTRRRHAAAWSRSGSPATSRPTRAAPSAARSQVDLPPARRVTPLRPSGCAAAWPPPTSRSPTARRWSPRWARARRDRNYLDAADTRSTLALVAPAVEGRWPATGVEPLLTRPRRRPARRRVRPTIDVGNAGTLLRLLPGWLAGQEGGAGRSTATTRSAAARSTGSPRRCGGWARS